MLEAATVLMSLTLVAGAVGPQVGVAEERQAGPDEPPRGITRTLFRRQGDGWQRAEPATRAHWAVCFDGREVGAIETRRSPEPPRATSGGQELAPGEVVPFRGSPSESFAGWPGGRVRRPLALSSAGRCADPDRWRRAALPPGSKTKLFAAMQRLVPVQRCDASGKWSVWTYEERNLRIQKAFVSRSREWLVEARAPEPTWFDVMACDALLGAEYDVQLFHVERSGEVHHLGSALRLVEAADFDGDGRSEVLAAYARYNDDGYMLFFDGFRRQVSYGWNYH